jgi:subtilisin family serine protease
VTNVARLLLGLVPVLAASAAATATALPATATALPVTAQVTHASQWWLTALHVPAALRLAPAAGKGVTVAVLSTGVDPSHPDLTGNVTTGPDFGQTGRRPGEPYWGAEGTAVASLIAGHGHGPGGTEGITGVAPDARILSLQVTLEYDDPLNSDSAITRRLPAAIAAGIRYAVGHGATVIALPLDPGTLGPGSSGDPAAAGGSAAERAAVSFALAHDVLLVAPAGDNGAGTNSVNYPAAYPGVIAVGATEHGGQLAPFTSTRSYVALAAPGAGTAPGALPSGGTLADPAGLTVAAPDGGYQSLASTDMSAALTAGVAALIRSRYPWLTVAEVTQSLERGVTAPPGRASRSVAAGWGHGELDAAAALTSAAAIAAAHPAPAPAAAPSKAVAVGPVITRTAHRATPIRSDPGRLLRSLIVDIVVAACVLIACLIAATTLTRLRRRGRSAKAAGSAAAARKGHNPSHASHARHARGQSDAPVVPVPPPTVIWPGAPARGPFAADAGHTPYRLRRPAGKPPWPPALPPGNPAPPLALPPAQPALEAADGPLPPWEHSPADFAAAPATDDAAPWPGSNTGPMYVWNPAATTGPLPAIDHEEDEED